MPKLYNQKFHRYCAGAALTEYKMYENGSPYECFHCYKVRNESTVTDLKDCIEALKSEILELRSTVQEPYPTRSKQPRPRTVRRSPPGGRLYGVVRKSR